MKKEIKFAHNAELQEPRKTVKKPGFSDFLDCIVESYCMNCQSGTVIIVGRRGGFVFVCVLFCCCCFWGGAERSKAERSEARRSVAKRSVKKHSEA